MGYLKKDVSVNFTYRYFDIYTSSKRNKKGDHKSPSQDKTFKQSIT